MNNFEPVKIDFASLLNKAQLEAVTKTQAPLCILAGAGTGKTRVITHKIAYLIEQGAEPEKILGVTFTNKAAAEMRERVDKILPGVAYKVMLGTFHGVSARILRRYGFYVGVNSAFLIYDADDSQKVLRKIAANLFNMGREFLDSYQQQIEKWQNEGILPDQIQSGGDYRLMRAKELYSAYWLELLRIGALDFNGLLLKWYELLLHPEGSKRLFAQFRHILVDEYQDTNGLQANIVQLLGKQAETIAIVGDDDQSIYSWRGAQAGNMQKFMDDMPKAHLVKLEANYRSTSTILSAANAVISNNVNRLGKNLIAVGAVGVPVRLMRAFHDRGEAEMVVSLIEDEVRRGRSLYEFAILMRTNSQSRTFEEALRKVRLPYRLIGGIKFYDRKEVKDVLATLRAALNPKSDVDFQRAISAVPRGIGDTSVKKVQEIAKKKELSLLQAMLTPEVLNEAVISSKTAGKMQAFAASLQELDRQCTLGSNHIQQVSLNESKRQRSFWPEESAMQQITQHRQLNAEEAIAMAAQISGIAERLQEDKSEEAQDRLENIGQLLSAAQQYVEDAILFGNDVSALGFLEAAALLSDVDDSRYQGKADGTLTLMTLHAAKGLEFDVVFMVGMEEFGFPHARALGENADFDELEEERRLAYVGMTRARKRLYLTYAKKRMIHGVVKGRVPSRFLRELPRAAVVGDMPAEHYEKKDAKSKTSYFKNHIELDADYAQEIQNDDELSRGERVLHAIFGTGTVSERRGSGRLARAIVRFDQDGKERAIITKHLRIV
jgi:DNA helicase II / ATP-dependent DNA helicase PcrA